MPLLSSFIMAGAMLVRPAPPMSANPIAVLDSTATIIVLVTDSADRSITGASILIDGIQIAPTDEYGSTSIAVSPNRDHKVQVRAFGYAPAGFSIRAAAGETKTASLPLASIAASLARELPGVRITAHLTDDVKRSDPGLAGFAHRRETLGGTFINQEQIRERGYPPLSLLLRTAPGVSVVSTVVNGMTQSVLRMRGGATVPTKSTDDCPIQLYLDGHQWPQTDRDIDRVISTHELAAVEIYPSSAWVPVQFMGPTSGCGTLALWTTDGLRH